MEHFTPGAPKNTGDTGDKDGEIVRLNTKIAGLQQDYQKALRNIESMNAVLNTVVAHDSLIEDQFDVALKLAQYQASHDPLTQLLNRLGFNRLFVPALEEADASETTLSLIMVDIDHFKRVNDIYGHDAGDRVLLVISSCLRTHLAEVCSLSRWGGEEFLILAPGFSSGQAVALAEVQRVAVEHCTIANMETVTCSFGVTGHLPGEDASSFLKRVDRCLYHAKNGGRNQVQVR